MIIKKIHAREVLDSRGNPTVECDVTTEKGVFRAMVPSGASAGSHEALELRDGDRRYHGKGVMKAVTGVNSVIARKVAGMDCTRQEEIDQVLLKLDGTENKSKFGANAILPVSMAICKAGAGAKGLPLFAYIAGIFKAKSSLPSPMCNVINGGEHAGQENSIQEHMLVPKEKSFAGNIRAVSETYHTLAKILKKKYGASAALVGDEGGFAPSQLTRAEDRFDMMLAAAKENGYEMNIALDPASSEFFKDGIYTIGEKTYTGSELIDFYADMCKTYPITSIEDGHAEDDWESWKEMTQKLGKKVQIVGDDLYVTNTRRIEKGISMKASNAVLIKLNQVGSVTETLDAIRMTQKARWNAVVSHRSGETEDSFIADLVVGTNAGQIKTGAPARSDRNAKYNQLLRIEEELSGK